MVRKVLRKYSIAGVNARSHFWRIETTMLAESDHFDGPYPLFAQSTLEDFLPVSHAATACLRERNTWVDSAC
jgi:hypothetical protein